MPDTDPASPIYINACGFYIKLSFTDGGFGRLVRYDAF